ncbi:hypothetical protein LRS12_14870 [Sphingomonas sp. J344]|nr:hypothetical protein [Sphingomonas sp. J344]MCR5871883.1 hypothetical protein [Sphingomonas sp. J344]
MAMCGHDLLVGDHLAQRPEREPDDLAAIFRRVDELTGKDQAAYRMMPADQRLGTRHRFATDIHLGLILQEQLARSDRAGQFAHQRRAVERGMALRQIDRHDGRIGARLFQRRFGAFGQTDFIIIAKGRDGDAPDQLDKMTFAIEIDRTCKALRQPLDERAGVRRAFRFKSQFDQRSAGGDSAHARLQFTHPVGKIEDQRVRTRPSEMAPQRLKIGDFAQCEHAPAGAARTTGPARRGDCSVIDERAACKLSAVVHGDPPRPERRSAKSGGVETVRHAVGRNTEC